MAVGFRVKTLSPGTGAFSTASHCEPQNLDIDALKIDRGFLLEAGSGQQGATVLRCVVDSAHTFGLRVVGEGVETEAQLDLLVELRCDEIQGFLLGWPSFCVVAAIDSAESTAWLYFFRREIRFPADSS
jgi:diguanylate cyclase